MGYVFIAGGVVGICYEIIRSIIRSSKQVKLREKSEMQIAKDEIVRYDLMK